MTIISNNCIAAHVYTYNHIQFNHPFMWCINDTSYIDFYQNIYDWNYQNAKFSFCKTKDHHNKNIISCKVDIDNRCTTYYMHYIIDPDKPFGRLEHDYNSLDIFEYCKTKYYNRVNRIKKDNIFFIIDMYRSYLKANSLYPFLAVPDKDLKELSQYDNVWCYTSKKPEDEHVRDCFKSSRLIIIDKEKIPDSTTLIAKHFTEKFFPNIK